MVSRRARIVAAALSLVYIAVNIVLFVVIPATSEWQYWGEPVRDGLAIGAAIAIGLPLFATAAGVKPS
jgi:hypothetical protein